MNYYQGSSLIETLVAIALGSFLLIGALYMFSSSKQAFLSQTGLSRIQENGRYAKFILGNDIRMAGFQGCVSLTDQTPTNILINPADNQTLTMANAIKGYANNGSNFSPALPSWLTRHLATGTQILPESDVLVIRKASAVGASLTKDMVNTDDDIAIHHRISIQNGGIYLIGDCEYTDIFQATAGTTANLIHHKDTANQTNHLSKNYQKDAMVYPLETYAYYLKNTPRRNAAGQIIPALYRQDIMGNEQELVEGVERMNIRYGVDTNNDGGADSYKTASEVEAANQWDKVISVDLALLLNSIEPATDKPQHYTFQGSNITANDKLLRRQWDAFITLRNREDSP